MTQITILGGTGYAGGHIAREAATRGLTVRALSRSLPEAPAPDIEYVAADVQDDAALDAAIAGTETLVVALSPRGDQAGTIAPLIARIAEKADAAGVRLGVIGGAGSLLVAPGGIRVVDTPEFPDAVKPEAFEMGEVLENLRRSPESLNWFYVSPAGGFGAWAEGEKTGTFRVGGDVLLADAEGKSEISGADFAQAVVDEVTTPTHNRARFTVAY
ncbi:NAD-dependent epimerase/dehydratase family protein [Mycetocola tolaasinivorans]|uniref:NAD-dependent epimerase/dehydratase family protein n=1 Tax=Mycetocola tolaasinivorans TaxID=76635 RepID=A0A3L7A9Q9_9MICO|nr:NAD(P)H-binding protein [Mycetocola tolaasinivorans]RLP76917.1 NAD-dependent epimerase/dehydratase family protein [Mycetocola tolaasinivorans]